MKSLEEAEAALEIAINRLENSVEILLDDQSAFHLARAESEALRRDRAKLAHHLDESKAREKELEALADEASRALGVAIAEVKAAIGNKQ